jgi:hypothetical protein
MSPRATPTTTNTNTNTMTTRNQLSRAASDIQVIANRRATEAMIAGKTRKENAWASVEGLAQQLANDSCECRWTLTMLRRRLADLQAAAKAAVAA